jgi:hypothetical protein
VEAEVRIFDRRHFDIAILVNHPGGDIMTKEQLLNWYGTASVGNSNVSADCEILHRRFD